MCYMIPNLTFMTKVVKNLFNQSKEEMLRKRLTLQGIGSLDDDQAIAIADVVLRRFVIEWGDATCYKPMIEYIGGKRFIRLIWTESGSRGSMLSRDVTFDLNNMTEENATMSEVMES